MKRLKHHREQISRITKDDRISGSRRILAEYAALWLDAETDGERELWKVVILSYVNGGRYKWVDDDEPAVTVDAERLEQQTVTDLKQMFTELATAKEGQCNSKQS